MQHTKMGNSKRSTVIEAIYDNLCLPQKTPDKLSVLQLKDLEKLEETKAKISKM